MKATMLVIVVVVAFALAVPTSAMAAKKPTPLLTKVISNIDMNYAWDVLEDITAMGTSDEWGFRGAGSASSLEASVYVRDQMQAMGLTDPALEKVPVDAWGFREAWVYNDVVGKLEATSFGGSPSTNGEITRELVNVGNGFHSDYIGKDVTDKIVIANWIGDDYWTDSMAMEAYTHGATAIIVTTYDSDYGNQPGAIECHDGLYRMKWPPLISISGDDGLKMIAALEKNPGMKVTVYSDIEITTQEQGGFGWNVVGYIPGKNWGDAEKDEFVILGDHTDSWYTGGMDDASGVAATLTLAKAFMMTYEQLETAPERTLIFTTHEAEEYGIQDAYYDWCYGAWYQITQTHPQWVGKSVAYLNFELMGKKGLPLTINLAPELTSFVHNVLAQNNAKLPYGFKVTPIVHSWADHWMFTAAGVPGIEVATSTAGWDAAYYHNQFDAINIIDPTYLGQLFEVFADMTLKLVTLPIVPYNFEVSAKNLNTLMTTSNDFGLDYLYPVYARYGLDPEKNMGRTMDASVKYLENARMLASMIKSADPAKAHEVNMQLMSIEAKIGQTLIAQGVWEQDWYPYQQSANDVIHMNEGIEMLKDFGMGYDVNDAIWELNWVGIMWYYDYMCAPNYYDQLSRLTGAEVASWGLQTHLLPAVDLWDEYDYLKSVAYEDEPDLSWVITSLEDKMVSQALMELEKSFETMWMGLENANAQMDTLIASL